MFLNLAEEKENFRLIKERSSGPNIIDAEKTIFFKTEDGSINNRVLKETYAKVTMRKKRNSGDEEKEISGSGQRKRAKTVNNILEHVSEHNKQSKAVLVSKIIDQEGMEFGENVMQETKKLNGIQYLKCHVINKHSITFHFMVPTHVLPHSYIVCRTITAKVAENLCINPIIDFNMYDYNFLLI